MYTLKHSVHHKHDGEEATEVAASPSPASGPPAMIPDDCTIACIQAIDCIQWILAVEKEAVFHTMAENHLTGGVPDILGPGVLLTVRVLYSS